MGTLFAKSDITKNACMLKGKLGKQGYDWWWHSFTAKNHDTGEEKSFFIEYYLCNPSLGGRLPVLGQAPNNLLMDRMPSYVMVKAGCWGKDARQLHRYFGWQQAKVKMDAPFVVEAGDCYADEEHLKGSIHVTPSEAEDHPEYMCDAGSMKWNLKVKKVIPFNVGYGTSKLLRALYAFEMYWHAQGMKTVYEGEVYLDGQRYDVIPEKSYGYADKNWGSNFTSPWLWLSSNHLISKRTGKELKNSAFDIGGGRPKVFFIPLKRILLGAFYYEGKEIEFNFSKFWHRTRTQFKCTETDREIIWHVQQENKEYMMQTNIHCLKEDMLWINYEAPDGTKRHNRLWNGGTGKGWIKLYRKKGHRKELVDEITVLNTGCEYGEMD